MFALVDLLFRVEEIGYDIGKNDEDNPGYVDGYIFGFLRAMEIRDKIVFYEEFSRKNLQTKVSEK